jgi:glycosyltransferase involved in cell wall biosynthesis
MNILHVVDQISQTRHGGSAKVPYQLARAQAKLGHKVTIFASDYQAKDQAAPEGVKLVKFKTIASYQSLRFSPGLFLADYSKFDIVHLHNYRTLVNILAANRLRKVPYVLQAHGNAAPISFRKQIKPIHDFIFRNFVLKRASHLIADAELEIRHYFVEGADLDRVTVIPVGIDTDEYASLPPRQNKGYKTVLFLGRLHEIKGCDLLIRAFAGLKSTDVRLVIAGIDYGHEAECRKLVTDLGIAHKVEWIGGVYGKDKLQAYVNADVFVMPSRYEMWGIAFLESLACGTPVIMTDRCGAASCLPKECGVALPFAECNLRDAIRDMLDSDFASEYREFRRAWVIKYDWQNIAKQILGVYSEVLNG